MSSFTSTTSNPPPPSNRQPWEEPRLVVERSLVARAQEGGGTEENWALQFLLGPLNGSLPSGNCV